MNTLKKLFAFLTVTLILLSVISVPSSADTVTTFYVAVNGSDTANGSANAPFATPQKALEEARKINGDKVIVFRSGVYKMTETIKLNYADNNTALVADGDVSFKGGTDIPFSSFKKVTDNSILSRIVEKDARENLICADLSRLGITNYGKIMPNGMNMPSHVTTGFAPTLTYKDKYLTPGQYPNGSDYMYTSEIISDGSDANYKASFTVDDDRYKKWSKATDIWALGFYKYDWAETINSVGIDADGVVRTTTNKYLIDPNRRVKFFNLLEEIDEAGEYYIDRKNGLLYMIAPKGFKQGESLTFSAYSNTLFQIDAASSIEFKGFRFEGTTNRGVYVNSGSGIDFIDCEFTAIGNTALTYNRCYNSTVENSHFHDLGSKGIYITNCGNREKLIQGGMKIVNCHFERFSLYVRTYNPAIDLNYDVGTHISNCEFNDSPHSAIRYFSNDTVIEYCEFYRCCTDTADSGVIYTGRCYNTWGNVIRYNYFHDLQMINSTTHVKQMMAVYLDDCSSQTSVYGNIFSNCSYAALYGGGRNNTFENNLIINNKKSLVFDARGTTTNGRSLASAMARSDEIKWETDIYAEKYPAIVNLRNDEPEIPKYNIVRNNVLVNTTAMNIHNLVSKYGTVKNNIYDIKETIDFNTDACWTVISKYLPDFKPIPIDKIGRYDVTVKIPAATPSTKADTPQSTEGETTGVHTQGSGQQSTDKHNNQSALGGNQANSGPNSGTLNQENDDKEKPDKDSESDILSFLYDEPDSSKGKLSFKDWMCIAAGAVVIVIVIITMTVILVKAKRKSNIEDL